MRNKKGLYILINIVFLVAIFLFTPFELDAKDLQVRLPDSIDRASQKAQKHAFEETKKLGRLPLLGEGFPQDISKYYDLKEDGKIRTFSSKEEGEKAMKEQEDRIKNFHSTLKTTSTDLPTNIDHPMYGLNYFVSGKSPEYYSDFTYGCGRDPNGGDYLLTQADLNTMRSLGISADPLRDGTWWMDIDRDGVSNTTLDQERVVKFLEGDLSQISIPGLETRAEAYENFLKELEIDWTSDINAYAANWLCHDYGAQTFINFNGIYQPENSIFAQDNGTNLQYDFSVNGVFGRAIKRVATYTSSTIPHEIVVWYNGPDNDQDPKNFDYKIYIEPQNKLVQKIGEGGLNQIAKEVWHGYTNNTNSYRSFSLCEYELNNGESTLTDYDNSLVLSWNPFDDNGVEGMKFEFPSSQIIEYSSNILVDAILAAENSEATGVLYPSYTRITKTITNDQGQDPTKPAHYNFEILVDYMAEAGKYSVQDTQIIYIQDSQPPVYDTLNNQWSDVSAAEISLSTDTSILDNPCQPDTLITQTARDVTGNSATYVQTKAAPIYTGLPYLLNDPYDGDTLELQLGQEETPENLGSYPEFADERTVVLITYTSEEIEWRGTYWLKRLVFTAENECGNPSPDTVFRYYKKPSATGIENEVTKVNFVVYPNPANEVIWVKWDGFPMESGRHPLSFAITDFTGRLVYSHTIDQQKTSINVSDYPAGLYLLKVYKSDQVVNTQKIIIR